MDSPHNFHSRNHENKAAKESWSCRADFRSEVIGANAINYGIQLEMDSFSPPKAWVS